ncbi:MAG: dihydropteroate synthase [Bacteroidetes bacterium GWF2_42_66]|nr:MAG: dihydropteroate synthase [Bacteroidetes bacterium GWA2_42_15]OFX98898.1 MAG: dihydropteroate synthase [Bacteroidetes bacterium GWE2_42_39]OFY45613.1 MAG: dihydropteroate synthase [Bacteroidetes bacterium GWF2_42_66]HBL77407.1 dihydropteroate synthase [Prolixibacteraceae bacterium]HCU62429.1 dihydropteroate synthase [Prolixibacteraceae bacterium]
MLITSNASKFFKRKHTIQLNGEIIDLKDPIVMGILNLSPDSFFDGGKYKNEKKILARAEEILEQGATFIDIGAVSTRPGASDVSTKTELDRLMPAVCAIRKKFPAARLSVDTFRSWVAVRVIEECGPCMVNDISGGNFDVHMFETIGKLDVPYVLMHIQGTPQTMQEEPEYDDIIKEISNFFTEKVKRLTKCGVKDVIIDPGFGFGKTLDDNYELLNRLDAFKVFQLPLLVGVSRKSMIASLLGHTPADSLNGTSVVNTLSLVAGADILRVHDVREAVEAVRIYKKLKEIAL